MCRDIFERQFPTCGHVDYCETRSRDLYCNGIRHHIIQNGLKDCKHCWVAQGNRKKPWRRIGLTVAAGRKTRLKLNHLSIVYPVQAVDLRRLSACLTWQRHYTWQTRAWACRELTLQRYSLKMRADLWRRGLDTEFPIYNMDDDTAESGLIRLLEPGDLPRDEDNPNEVAASHQMCPICHGSFISEDPEQRHQTGDGGLRQIPCKKEHVFCVECIRELIIQKAEVIHHAQAVGVEPGGEFPFHHCPFCNTRWTVILKNTRTMKSRTRHMFRHHHERMLNSYMVWAQVPNPPKEVGSRFEYLVAVMVLFFAWPTFHAVSHSMSVWPRSSHNGGRLPVGQLVMIGLTGAVFQTLWLFVNPILFFEYLRYKIFNELVPRFWLSSYGRTVLEWEDTVLERWARFAHKWEMIFNFLPNIREGLGRFAHEWEMIPNFMPNARDGFQVEWEAQVAFWGPIFGRN